MREVYIQQYNKNDIVVLHDKRLAKIVRVGSGGPSMSSFDGMYVATFIGGSRGYILSSDIRGPYQPPRQYDARPESELLRRFLDIN